MYNAAASQAEEDFDKELDYEMAKRLYRTIVVHSGIKIKDCIGLPSSIAERGRGGIQEFNWNCPNRLPELALEEQNEHKKKKMMMMDKVDAMEERLAEMENMLRAQSTDVRLERIENMLRGLTNK